MREILFRGKQVLFNDWIEGTGIFNDGTNTWLSFNEPEKTIAYGLNHKRVHAETIGQFTGLTDKNGKKIFEGDIVRFDNRLSVVEYVDCRMGFAFRKTIGHGIVPGFTMSHWETCEILGNIHDNPELLGDGNDGT